ncbi:tetratricopeptide repeat protein [Cyclobacterium xiamenense]|jgi:tetratricopeptide (TPR) repeat protein|uniref:tetratricopeptide repeat protein n=1 Tax=Cyclobacterium xiamenense TaxID=1297121 RepID=UPI0035CFD0BF
MLWFVNVCCLVAFIIPFGGAFGQNPTDVLDRLQRLSETNPRQAYRELSGFLRQNPGLGLADQAEAAFLEGQLLMEFGIYNQATTKFYEAEEHFKNMGCTACLADVYNQIGKLYYKTKRITDALERHKAALHLYEDVQDTQGMARSKGLIGSMYEKLGDYVQALVYQNQAIELIRGSGDSTDLSILFENVGSIYEDLEKYDSAERYFQLAYTLNIAMGTKLNMPGNINNLGDTRRKTNRAGESLSYYEEAIQISKELGNNYLERSATEDLGKAYAALGDFEKAYEQAAKARKLSETIFSEEAARQLATQEFHYEIKEKQQEIAHLKGVHVFETRIRWLLLMLILTLLGLGWGLISRQRLKIRATKSTVKKQEELLEINQRLIQTEKENINLLEARMAAEVVAQQKALSAQTLHVIEKNEMLKEIQSKLKAALEHDPQDQRKKLRNLVKQIDANLGQDRDWESFKHTFESVHEDFLKNLTRRNPSLTTGDVKLACLMKMNLSSREIAATLGISMESLRISRYRLRKRLQLLEGKDLQHYLHCL